MRLSEIDTQAREFTPEAPLDFAPSSPRARGWLTRLRVAGLPDRLADPSLPPPLVRRRPSGYLISFIALVALPALAGAVYFTFFASDEYVAESRFAVHAMATDAVSDDKKSKKATTTSSLTGGLSAASEDSYLVAAYVHSRACVDEVNKTLALREIFRRPEADFISRLDADASPEALVKYWNLMVTAYVDPPSGIVTVTVSAFRREDALALSQAILAAAEKMANALSSRAREDIMKMADAEVASSQERVVASLEEMRAFRDKAGFIDPKSQALSLTQGLEVLLERRIKLEGDYEVSSRAMSREAPTLQAIKSRLDQLDSDIAAEKAKLTSRSEDPTALANLLPEYESLLLRNTFAEKLYGLAADGLERARLRAEAQTIYLDVFVPPAIPQEALYPERVASSLSIAIALLILWGIGALTAALVEDHKL
jgi:capsular polysaccharide transport system permease protein